MQNAQRPNKSRKLIANGLIFVCVLYLAFIVGNRSTYVGTDTENYMYFYDQVIACNCSPAGFEPIFGFLARGLAILSTEVDLLFICISFLQLFLLVAMSRQLSQYLGFERNDYRVILLTVAFSFLSPFFMAAQINIIRQGVAALAVCSAIIAMAEKRLRPALIWGVLAIGFHFSAVLYIAVLPLFYLKFRNRAVIFGLLVCCYTLGLSEILIRIVSETLNISLYSLVANYGVEADYRSGVRIDFLLFSLAPIAGAIILHINSTSVLFRERIKRIGELYSLLLLPFLLLGWGGYSDRYAFGAWMLLPGFGAVLMYRIISKKTFFLLLFIVFLSVCYFLYSYSQLLLVS